MPDDRDEPRDEPPLPPDDEYSGSLPENVLPFEREPGDDPPEEGWSYDPHRTPPQRRQPMQFGAVREASPANAARKIKDVSIAECLTDAAHAERFAQAFGMELRFDHRRDRWLVYETPRWRTDIDGAVYRKAIEFARLRQLEAVQINDKKTRKTVLDFCIKAESKAQLDRTVSLAKMMPPIADNGESWDLDPMLLGAPNGLINLKNGLWRLGDPEDHITMSTSVKYDASAECPRWEQFILEIFNGDAELADWVHRFVGYAITGLTHEQVLAFFYGRGANGKGTMMNTIAHVLGDYSYNMPFSTIEMRQRSSIPNDVAALDKRRWVTASETNDGTQLNEARIKALTGCDPVTARFLHGEWFTFQPIAKFILAVNHKPVVKDDSYGFWRRIRLVPFLVAFTGDKRDPTLEGHFKEVEAAGILTWCVKGALKWQEIGLGVPSSIASATSEYQSDSDALSEFFQACVEDDPQGCVKGSDVQKSYQKWCDVQGFSKQERMPAKVFGAKLSDKVARRHTKSGAVYDGIRLITSNLF